MRKAARRFDKLRTRREKELQKALEEYFTKQREKVHLNAPLG